MIARSNFAARSLLMVAFVMLIAQTSGKAAPGDALSYAKGFSGTIDYVVGTVDLTPQANPIDQYGFSTGTLSIAGVPHDADIVGAYLYWETITLDADPAQAAGVKFRDHEILLNDVVAVKKSSQALQGSSASCWSSGVPLRMTLFRADVLPILPARVDSDGRPTGKRIVNDADLAAHGLPAHTVYLPVSAGNQVPESAGASLVLVYSHPTQPFRKVVFYDGLHIQPSTTTPMTQTLRGFYKSASVKSAKITHLIASGQPNNNERVFFNDADPVGGSLVMNQISGPDPISGGASSQRTWSALTYDVSQYMNPGANSSGGYGETATTMVDHTPGGGYDCLTWGAVIFSTAMADAEAGGGDGIPDALEDTPGGLEDPDDTQLPDLNAMGASSGHKDLFVEVNSLWAAAGTAYGDASAPYSDTAPTATDTTGHIHLPTPEDFKRIGDAYAAHGITLHVDVGDIDVYHAHGIVTHADWVDDYSSTDADAYFVPSVLARGGETVKERACDPANPNCQFPAYPGTIGWKFGMQLYRDAPVGDNGEELDFTNPATATAWQAGAHRRRFDRSRLGLFHYLLYAHARGTPRSQPCLAFGEPSPYDAHHGTSCVTPNPNFNPLKYHVPTTAGGVADLPGGNALVTLGLWDEFVGRPFVRASTTFHELGHNLNLWHGGAPAVFGDSAPAAPAAPASTYIEPNCKPNYLSSMSYLFQVHGLFDDSDGIHLDYSGTAVDPLNESVSLADGPLSPLPPYRSAWYAPASSPLAIGLGVPAAGRYCSGRAFAPNPNPLMARVYTSAVAAPVDWDGNPLTSASGPQDVNLDGTLSATLNGFSDWDNIRLNQLASGRKVVKYQVELADGTGYADTIDYGSADTIDFGSADTIDFGSGDTFQSADTIDFGSGVFFDQTSGSAIDFGSADTIDFGSADTIDFGSADTIDFGSADTIDFGSGTSREEVDYDIAKALGPAVPYGLSGCVIGTSPDCLVTTGVLSGDPSYHRNLLRWNAATVGHVVAYLIERRSEDANVPYAPSGSSPTNSFVDPEELPSGKAFSYRVRSRFDDGTLSGWSLPVTIVAVNDAPLAAAESYTVATKSKLNVRAPGVLANDADADSPSTFTARRVVLVDTTANGTLVLNAATGAFTYKANPTFVGIDTFTYKVNDGPWSGNPAVPLSADSDVVTVTITVTKKK